MSAGTNLDDARYLALGQYPSAETENPCVATRFVWLDLARAAATLLMVQGHTIDVLLAPAYRSGTGFAAVTFVRGLTAPTFLLLCGFSFGLSSANRWSSLFPFSGRSLRRMSRFCGLISLGYAMHLPARSPLGLLWVDQAGWDNWCRVDVLQCIGVTLLVLQSLLLITRTPRRFSLTAAALGAGIMFFAPLLTAVEWNRYVPLAIGSYLTPATGSLFPLLPWSGYVLLGSAVGTSRWMWGTGTLRKEWLLICGSLSIMGGLISRHVPGLFLSSSDFWRARPDYFLIRFGSVCLLVTVATIVAKYLIWGTALVRAISEASLLIYLVHLSILYGSSWNPGLYDLVGAHLSPVATFASIIVMWGAMVFLSLARQRLSMRQVLRLASFGLLQAAFSRRAPALQKKVPGSAAI